MKKVDLNRVAGEFEMISTDTHVYYNKETGEFDFYMDSMMDSEYDNSEKFEDGNWIAGPDIDEIDEYDMMVDFACTVEDPRAKELFSIALDGKGAFRRFRDVLDRTNLSEEWYAFRSNAYVRVARRWCIGNDIPFDDPEEDADSDEKE